MDELGDYRLGEAVETGAHTTTYRAKRGSDKRDVLLKTIKPGLRVTASMRSAIERERDALAALDHPCLPTLLELVHEEEQLALVFIDHHGQRLDGVLERVARIDPQAAIAIAIRLASALSAIHHHGPAHGWLRPEVVEIGKLGAVYLHGLGTLDSSGRSDDESLMLPEHMAPEQLLGEGADAQTDVFALGTLLYRMITGASPFGAGHSAVSQSIRHDKPAVPSKLAGGVPEGLDRIVMRCLGKRSRDRYPDMASVSAELQRVLRRDTSLPSDVLVSRALALAGMADELPHPLERGVAEGGDRTQLWLRRAMAPAAGAVLLALAALVLWQWFGDDPTQGTTGTRGIVKGPAQVRVLADPWAEVHIDGKLADVTPVGHPIEVSPGRHNVVFKHPNAPDETRSIEIIAGQTILLDVEMQVVRPMDAGTGVSDADVEDDP
jgi:hypothetical protein